MSANNASERIVEKVKAEAITKAKEYTDAKVEAAQKELTAKVADKLSAGDVVPKTSEGTEIVVIAGKSIKVPGSSVTLDDDVSQNGENGVKSKGIWSFVKGLLPSWLTPSFKEPITEHQDISDLATKGEVSAKYTKPSTGIPKSDLASGVVPDVVAPASDIASGNKAADAYETGKKLDTKANIAKWVFVKNTGGEYLLGVIGEYSEGKAIGYKNGIKADVSYEFASNRHCWYVGGELPDDVFYAPEEGGEIKANNGDTTQLGTLALADGLTPSAMAALFADTAFIEAVKRHGTPQYKKDENGEWYQEVEI